MNILVEITERKKVEVAARRREVSIAELRTHGMRPMGVLRRSLQSALETSGVSVIAEIKRRSPSKGELRRDLDVAEIARSYDANGASAISVLTDGSFFGGSAADLQLARANSELPVLQKDFIVDEYQLYEARSMGADAVLLIVRVLDGGLLGELLGLAGELELDVLVEVHSAQELNRAADAGARIIGVNNRDLDTFEVSLQTAMDLRPMIPDGVVAVSESGIRNGDDVRRLRDGGYDAILVGETLMTAVDPGAKLAELLQGVQP